MKQIIQLQEAPELVAFPCRCCGGVSRLIGSEPHPVKPKTDLLTYCCTSCDDLVVVPQDGPTMH